MQEHITLWLTATQWKPIILMKPEQPSLKHMFSKHFHFLLPRLSLKAPTMEEVFEGEPRIGGHDFVFVDELSPGQTCSICLLAMRSPVQTVCGHRFCESCLLETFRYYWRHDVLFVRLNDMSIYLAHSESVTTVWHKHWCKSYQQLSKFWFAFLRERHNDQVCPQDRNPIPDGGVSLLQ